MKAKDGIAKAQTVSQILLGSKEFGSGRIEWVCAT